MTSRLPAPNWSIFDTGVWGHWRGWCRPPDPAARLPRGRRLDRGAGDPGSRVHREDGMSVLVPEANFVNLGRLQLRGPVLRLPEDMAWHSKRIVSRAVTPRHAYEPSARYVEPGLRENSRRGI